MQSQSVYEAQKPIFSATKFLRDATKRKPKKLKDTEAEREFYRLAALLANPDLGDLMDSFESNPRLQCRTDFNTSRYLEKSYQEKSPLFVAEGTRLKPWTHNRHLANEIRNRWQIAAGITESFHGAPPADQNHCFYLFDEPRRNVSINGREFSTADQAILLSQIASPLLAFLVAQQKIKNTTSTAYDFHQCLQDHLRVSLPLLLWGRKENGHAMVSADRLRLFWAHRMHLKSRQTKGGADPSIRYFHAIFHSSERPKDNISVLYWLSFDDDNKPTSGEFISGIEGITEPLGLCCPRQEIEAFVQRDDTSLSHFMRSVLKLYLKSTQDPES